MVRYAVNVGDAQACSFAAQILLRDFIDEGSPIVQTGPNADDMCVVLGGPSVDDAERLESLLVSLITVVGPRKLKRPMRVYSEGPRGGWTRETRLAVEDTTPQAVGYKRGRRGQLAAKSNRIQWM